MVNNCCMEYQLTEVLCKGSLDKNPVLAEQSLKLLARMLQNVGPRFQELPSSSLNILIKTLCLLINGKRANIQTYALQICEYIHSLIGNQNFTNLIGNLLSQQEMHMLISQIQGLTSKKNAQLNAKSTKQQDKENIKQIKRESMA